MLRYTVLCMTGLGLIGLAAGGALAQPAPAPAATPAPAAPVAAPAAVISMAEPQPGDHWTYEVRDEISGTVTVTRANTITEVTPTEISVQFRVVGTPNQGLNIYDRSWNLVDGRPWKYSPNDGSGIQTPLAVGKSWSFRSNGVNGANGATWKRTGTSKVLGQETVTTRAGTFETFKIETTFTAQNVSDPTRKDEIVQQTWYAPAIDHWVKRAQIVRSDKHLNRSDSMELTEYGRKQ